MGSGGSSATPPPPWSVLVLLLALLIVIADLGRQPGSVEECVLGNLGLTAELRDVG